MQKSDSYFHQEQAKRHYSVARNILEHTCALNVDSNPEFVRQSNIVCTIGPSCYSHEVLDSLIKNGMNIIRLNVNSGSKEFLRKNIDLLRSLEKKNNFNPCLAICLDITSPTDNEKSVDLKDGDFITLTIDETYRCNSTCNMLWVDTCYFHNFCQSVRKGDRIYVDDGFIRLIAKEVYEESIYCLIETGGELKASRRVDLQRERLYSQLTEKQYYNDLEWAKDNDLAEAIPYVDGVVICRGKLGLEINHEKIFKLQKNVIGFCNLMMTPVFVQSQLLESMRYKPRPTRAEISDVANAVLDGADGLVLTVETAKGFYPVESLKMLHKTTRQAETGIFYSLKRKELKQTREKLKLNVGDIAEVTAIMAVEAASSINATAILVPTITGRSASLIAAYRPSCPVIAILRRPKNARLCHFYRGIHPFVYEGEKIEDWGEDMDLRINAAIQMLRDRKFVSTDDQICVVTGNNPNIRTTNTVRTFQVPAEGDNLLVVKPPKIEHWVKEEDRYDLLSF